MEAIAEFFNNFYQMIQNAIQAIKDLVDRIREYNDTH